MKALLVAVPLLTLAFVMFTPNRPAEKSAVRVEVGEPTIVQKKLDPDEQMVKACNIAADAVRRACEVGVVASEPKIDDPNMAGAKLFARDVCEAAEVRAAVSCISGDADRYNKSDLCLDLATWVASMVAEGGNDVLNGPKCKRVDCLGQQPTLPKTIQKWAIKTGALVFEECVAQQAEGERKLREKRKPYQPKPSAFPQDPPRET